MKPIRKLYFKNAAGELRGLNGEFGAYATDLAGFGFSLSPSFADIGYGFFPAVEDQKVAQGSIAFTVVLTRNAYAAYKDLWDWLSSSKSLTIVYNPTGSQEYCIDVVISFVQKGELNEVGWLEIPCSFLPKTPWYLAEPTIINMSGSGKDNRMRFPYRFTNDLRFGLDNRASIRTTLWNRGHIPGAIHLTIRGSIVSPRIWLIGNSTGTTYGSCGILSVFSDDEALEVSTLYENSYVQKVNADGSKTNLLDVLDLTSNPFFHIPVEEPCTLIIEAESAMSAEAEALVYSYYRSV